MTIEMLHSTTFPDWPSTRDYTNAANREGHACMVTALEGQRGFYVEVYGCTLA